MQKWCTSAFLPLIGLIGALPAFGQASDAGTSKPVPLAAFKADAPTCSSPKDLDRALVFLKDNERDFMKGVDHGLRTAANDRKLKYSVFVADNAGAAMKRQADDAKASSTGAYVIAPVDARNMASTTLTLLASGAYVGSIVPPPATTILNAPQYQTGKVLGDAAARYIETKLGGTAKVVLLTHDSNQFLARRFTAIRDSLARLPGALIVADISPDTVDRKGGYATMRTILVAQPYVDVVLGADTVVLGALDALREAGKARNDQFLGGIDGEPEAISEIRSLGPYKATVSLASPIFGYAMGQHAADWLEGKSIPQAIDVVPKLIEAANLATYEADLADPGPVYADTARRDAYLKFYGNICFDTRDQFLNFPWSSEP